jgi:DNA polymerase-3 subunit epsilon
MLETLEPSAARPLTYDFDLLKSTQSVTLSDTPLRDLIYTVFDTETTGLDPVSDEVVQLGAIRVVNGKVVSGEVFDTLVNPGMVIPKRSTDVHRITNAMVAVAPAFDDVCAKFHAFASGSVFVAHNAAFDMAFLHKQTSKTGHRFDHPVLDTVLMSAAIFGGSAVHTLDAICDRLDIRIHEDQRHTAIGDATATAKALVAMIAIFEGRGIQTYGALEFETRKHRKILKS